MVGFGLHWQFIPLTGGVPTFLARLGSLATLIADSFTSGCPTLVALKTVPL